MKARSGAGIRVQQLDPVRDVGSDAGQFSLQHRIGMLQRIEYWIRPSVCGENAIAITIAKTRTVRKQPFTRFPLAEQALLNLFSRADLDQRRFAGDSVVPVASADAEPMHSSEINLSSISTRALGSFLAVTVGPCASKPFKMKRDQRFIFEPRLRGPNHRAHKISRFQRHDSCSLET